MLLFTQRTPLHSNMYHSMHGTLIAAMLRRFPLSETEMYAMLNIVTLDAARRSQEPERRSEAGAAAGPPVTGGGASCASYCDRGAPRSALTAFHQQAVMVIYIYIYIDI